MNTNTPLSPNLESHVRAMAWQQPDADRVDAAQQHLQARIDRYRPRTRAFRGVAWAGAACTAVLAMALTLGPIFTGRGDVQAFAAVQHRLQDFKTLQMTIHQRANGIELPTIRTWADRAGDVRTDIGDSTSVIVNVQQRTVLTLLHAQRKAMRMPLHAGAGDPAEKALGWIDTIRQFKGKARPLSGTRVIDGVVTHGWALDTSGMHIELWADDDSVPRAVDISGGVNLHQRLKLILDQPIDPARFSTTLPPGYTLAQSD